MSYIIEKLKKTNYLVNNHIKDDLNIVNKFVIYLDLIFSMIFYGAGITDYFQYDFYKLRHIEKKKFIVYRKRMKIVYYFNDTKSRIQLDDKKLFNEKFEEYIGRDWLFTKDMSFESFTDFINKHPRFIYKPLKGSHGKGIGIIDTAQLSSISAEYDRLKSDEALIEEIIEQHESIAEFNPSSINSLRVVTIVTNEGVAKIMTGNFRVGRGNKIADNFHHQGIASLLDLDSGVVVTSGIDSSGDRYNFHPISNKQIIGFRIPYWEEVKDTVLKAALLLPDVKYVGWDIAIGQEGKVYIIEGNAAADPDITQIPDKVGKWELYKKYMK